MKLTKMSLVAAVLIGSSAFAIDNVKVSGDADVFYATSNAKVGYAGISGNDGLFSKDSSAADAGLNFNITADLAKNDLVTVSAGAGYTVLTTLGLENNLVSNVWGSAHTAEASKGANFANGAGPFPAGTGAKVKPASWLNEAWVAATAGKTTVKLGRMELDTPLVFTEKWSIEKNTFEAAVVVNQDLPDTTLVAAYVGAGNGNETFGQDKRSNVEKLGLANGAVVNGNGDFSTFGTNGAYAVGVINNSYKPLTAQAWYFQLQSLATAYWLQGDVKVDNILAGLQYTSGKVGDGDSSGTYALMVGYEMKDLATIKAAFSQTSDKGVLHGANSATGTGASKLYTEAWWNYGYVAQADTTAYNVTIESPEKASGIADLGFYWTYANQDQDTGPRDLNEITLTASKSFGPLDATVAYIYTDLGKVMDSYSTLQAYLTLNF